MKYKFKAFVAPILLIIFLHFCNIIFNSSNSIGQCGVPPCERRTVSLITTVFRDSNPGSGIHELAGFLIDSSNYLALYPLLLLLSIVLVFIGFNAGKNLRKFRETNSTEYQEKYLKSVRKVNRIFKLILIIVIVFSLFFLVSAIKVKNPRFGKMDYCSDYYDPVTDRFILPPSC